MAINFLDKTGLTHFWQVIKSKFISFENLNQSGPGGSTDYTLEWIRDPNTDSRYYIPQGTYSKPSGGIPESDLANEVTSKLHTVSKDSETNIYKIDGSNIAAKYDDELNNIAETYAKKSQIPSTYVTTVNNRSGAITLTASDVGLNNVDNVKQYSASNPPPYPVTSVAGKTGAVTLSATNIGLDCPDPPYNTSSTVYEGFVATSTELAKKQTTTITDSGNYFTTDTVEAALQQLAAQKSSVTIIRWGEDD